MVLKNHIIIPAILTFLCNTSIIVSAPSGPIHLAINDDKARGRFFQLLNTIADVNKKRLNALTMQADLDQIEIADGVLRGSVPEERNPVVAILVINKIDPTPNTIHEIYDSDVHTISRDTPVPNIIQHIKDYYDEILDTTDSKNNVSNEDILEKLYEANYYTGRKANSNYKEEYIAKLNNSQLWGFKKPEPSDGEEIVSNREKVIPVQEASKVGNKEIVGSKGNSTTPDSGMDKKQMLRLFKSCSKKAAKRCKKACKAASKRVCETYKCSKKMKKSFKKHCDKECKTKFSD